MKQVFVLSLLPLLGLTMSSLCPSPEEIRSQSVKEQFNFDKMLGFWYELAMIDVTQPNFCGCQTSNKTLSDTKLEFLDEFTIECVGSPYVAYMNFELTNTSGILFARWKEIPLVGNILFSDTVVDFGENKETGEYDWIIEFQCISNDYEVQFFGLNFYSREYENMKERIKVMEQRVRNQGLGSFLDSPGGLHLVNHTNCKVNHDS